MQCNSSTLQGLRPSRPVLMELIGCHSISGHGTVTLCQWNQMERCQGSGMVESHSICTGQNGLLLIRILGLIEEEVGGQLLVLVTREVSLDD
jgi:hypothetical protein